MATLSTWKFQEDWETKIAARLDKPLNWKDVCDVRYMQSQTVILPYVSAAGEPIVSEGHFAAAADRNDTTKVVPLRTITMSSESLTIISTDFDGVYIDFADEAQSRYTSQMSMADLLGKKLEERIEARVLAEYANWTDLGDNGSGGIGLAATQFTVNANTVDDAARGIIEQIITANGYGLYLEKGGFSIWRPADRTALVTFMQANGFTFADEALKNGAKKGQYALELYNYFSTSHTANHVMAGVRGVQILGLQSSTYGKTYRAEHPASSTAGFLPGTYVYWRLDYGLKVQTNLKPTLFDFNVA